MGTKNYIQVLKNAKTILLVDWASTDVPLALLKAGFMVISYSPGNYSLASYKTDYGKDKVNFQHLDNAPGEVDIVSIFRPEEEHEEIILKHALPLKAKVIWLQPPVTSKQTAAAAIKKGFIFIEGQDIAAAASEMVKADNNG